MALFALGTGCSEAPATKTEAAHGDEHAHETEQESPWHFVEGRGILLNEQGKKATGMQLADVGFDDFQSDLIASGRIFKTATPDEPAKALVALSATKANRIEPGATVRASTGPDAPELQGRVEHIDRQTAAATGNMEVIIALDDTAHPLKSGDFAQFRIATKGAGGAATLPKSSILETARGDFVYVLNGEYLLLTPVTVGNASDDQIEVLEGLFEGDVVASAGTQSLWLTELQAINGGVACTHGH